MLLDYSRVVLMALQGVFGLMSFAWILLPFLHPFAAAAVGTEGKTLLLRKHRMKQTRKRWGKWTMTENQMG